jgi:tripartite-type tricarboxylate transporter receptor subunit TctC
MRIFAAIALGLASAGVVHAQSYPSKPIRFIVPDAPGGSQDLRARQIAPKLSEALGQPVVIDNRPGGNAIIGAEAAAKAPADGYTIFLGNIATQSLNPLAFKTLPYRPDEDFVPVTAITSGFLVVAIGSHVGATTMSELIGLAKKEPGSIRYGGQGYGGPQHLLMEQISSASGAAFTFVPYKATGTAIQDVLGGHIAIALNYWSVVGPHVKAGKLRALAVAAGQRLAVAPEVPTLAEAGFPGIEGGAWQGVFVPVGTSPAIVARLHRELARIMALPEIRNPIIETGAEPGGNTPEDFAAFVRADREKWKKVAEKANLVPE